MFILRVSEQCASRNQIVKSAPITGKLIGKDTPPALNGRVRQTPKRVELRKTTTGYDYGSS